MELALYDPTFGFFATGGAAGRQGDFLTSPEVGPLFGAVLARALDTWWTELDNPDPYVVVEAGAGAGTLAAAVVAAEPRCLRALNYVMVERSDALRARQPGGGQVSSLPELPSEPFAGVVIANELLDNLPFHLLERGERWEEVRVGEDAGRLTEMLLPAPPALGREAERLVPVVKNGARVPLQLAARSWLAQAFSLVNRGRVVVIDYADTTPSMASRPHQEWLRTYRSHGRGGDPMHDPGSQDITCEVAVDQLAWVGQPVLNRAQADFLRDHGIDELTAGARATWHERAHIGDLVALKARSRVGEAAALTDQTGLGAFRVLEWDLS